MQKPKLLYIHDKSGCSFWRSWQPAQFMQKQGLADVRFLEAKFMNVNNIAEALKWCDVVTIRGLMDTEGLATLKQYQHLGKLVCTDYDDLHFNVSPWNPAYKHFGMDNIQIKDPTTGKLEDLWIDGKGGFDIKRNKKRFHSYKAILQEADLITTPTIYLKNAMAEISGREDNIRVIPNAIDLEHWKPLEGIRTKYPGKFRFGWAVSNSHGEDWIFIKKAINNFLVKHPDATFVCIGDASMDIRNSLPKGQVEWYPFSDLWEYHYSLRMSMLGLDVAIAPLADTEFNKNKSPLKFAEYTAFGWPVIAQDIEPYSMHMVNGETGILCKDTESWENALELMYSRPDLRSKLNFNAMFTLRELFDLKKVSHEWANTFKELISGVPTQC